MRKHFFPSTIICVIFSLLLFSCKKETTIDSSLINEAKTWFTTVVLAEENDLLARPYNEIPKTSPERVLARMNRLSKKFDWTNAKTNYVNGLEYVVVPLLKDDLKLKNNFFVERLFLFYKHPGKGIQLEVVELLTKYKILSNSVDIVSKVLENKLLNKRHPIEIQDALVFFYTQYYKALDAYKIDSTSLKSIKANCLNKNNTNDGQLTPESVSGDCTEWGVFYTEYDNNGNIIYEELLFTYWVGACGNGSGDDTGDNNDPTGTGGGGNGGASGDDEYDLDAEAILLGQVLSTSMYPQEKNVSYSNETLTEVVFNWTVAENSSNLWKVLSSDIAEGYNSGSTGAILYRLEHQGSTISGQTVWGRIRRNGAPGVPFINISWSENSSSTSLASDYKSGTVSVSGSLKNYSIPFKTVSNSCTIRVI